MPAAKYASTFGFTGLLAGSLIVALDAVALSPSLPIIEDALQATSVEIYWAGVAYTLGAATFLPLFPAVSDAVGRRAVSIVTLVMFLIGIVVCGTATKASTLLVGRVLQGIGGGGILGMLYVVMADLFDLRWRAKALAINGLVWLLGTSVGPILGGGFSANVSWRWIFWIALPINGIALFLVAAFLKISHHDSDGARLPSLSWQSLDYIGSALMVASLSSFLIPITWGGTTFAWDSPQTLAPLILGCLGLVGFVVYELLVPEHPILPTAIFNDRTVAIVFMQVFIVGFVQFGLVFYLPLYYQVVKGYSPLISGVALLPETLLAGPMTTATGLAISKLGRYKTTLLIGWSIMVLGLGLLNLLAVDSSPAQWIFLNVPVGIAIGVLFLATTIAVQAPVEDRHVATASGLVVFARTIGQAISIGASNAIVSNELRAQLEKSTSGRLRANAVVIAKNFASPKLLLQFLHESKHTAAELGSAYVKALQSVWWMLFGVSCCGLLSTIVVRDVSLDRTQQSVRTAQEKSDISACESSGIGSGEGDEP